MHVFLRTAFSKAPLHFQKRTSPCSLPLTNVPLVPGRQIDGQANVLPVKQPWRIKSMGLATLAQQQQQQQQDRTGKLEFKTPLKVVLYPNPKLRAKNMPISVFDDKLENLVKEMFDIMYRTDGIGLSAPQVGVNVQVMVFNPEGEKGKGEEVVLVNPKVHQYAKRCSIYTEGCLSFPAIEAAVERPISVKVEAQNIKGKTFFLHLKGMQARVFQHEHDHLQSILYFDRMRPEILETIAPRLQELEKAYYQQTGLYPEKIRERLSNL